MATQVTDTLSQPELSPVRVGCAAHALDGKQRQQLAVQVGGVSPNPRKFREAPFGVFFAKTFHNWPEKRKVLDVNHGQVRAE
jgi:hypothetical protein